MAAVLQLLDRHNRDCAAVAAELGVPHLVTPDAVPQSPFEVIAVKTARRWRETALWWPKERTLVVAEAIGTNRFFAGDRDPAGVHLLLRLTPPRATLGGFEPEHLLVGHGEGLHGPAAAVGLQTALEHSRRGLPSMLLHVPAFARDARRAADGRSARVSRRGRPVAAASRTAQARFAGGRVAAAPRAARPRTSGVPAPRGRPIGGRPLPRRPTRRADQRLHRLGRHLLPPLRPRRARDRLVHQRPAEVVDTRRERLADAVRPELHPARLDIRDQRVQREPRDRVQEQRLAERRSSPRATLAGRSAPPSGRTAAARTR